jgi:NAD(P)-dependent dehydrogenase (short-subunit alcohol dehydrogenase family)
VTRSVVLITGCSSGFGAAMAATLAGDGHRVYATMRDPATRNAAAAGALRATGGDLHVLELDVTDPASVHAAFARVAGDGGLDAVVHNAGVAAIGPVEAHSPELVARMFDVNVVGAVRVQQAALPLLRRSADPRVVVVTSTLARERAPLLAAYTASKHALDALFECWSLELNPEGIRTVRIQPGTVPTTAMLDNLLSPDRDADPASHPLAARADQLVAGLRTWGAAQDAPSPDVLADAIRAALSPASPACIVVDPTGFDGTTRINETCEAVQDDLLERYGMNDLARPTRG